MKASLPPKARLSRFSSVVLAGDFLDPPEAIAQRLGDAHAIGLTHFSAGVAAALQGRWRAAVDAFAHVEAVPVEQGGEKTARGLWRNVADAAGGSQISGEKPFEPGRFVCAGDEDGRIAGGECSG